MSQHKPSDYRTPEFYEAQAILALIGPDPDADAHRAELLYGLGAQCAIHGCVAETRSGQMCARHLKAHQRRLVANRANRAQTINRLVERRAS